MPKPSRSEDQATVTIPRDPAWAQLLSSVAVKQGRPDGDGWRTMAELAVELGKCQETIAYYVARWRREKRIEEAYGTNSRNQRTLYIKPRQQVAIRGQGRVANHALPVAGSAGRR